MGKHSKLSTGPGLPSGVSTLIVLDAGPFPLTGPAPLKATTRAKFMAKGLNDWTK